MKVCVYDPSGTLIATVDNATTLSDVRSALPQQRQQHNFFAQGGRVISQADETRPLRAPLTAVVLLSASASSAASRCDPHGFYVRSCDPSAGPARGGTIVTLLGAFPAVAPSPLRVRFGRTAVAVLAVTSSSSATVVTPEHAPGPVSVEVAADGRRFSARGDVLFTFLPVSREELLVHPTRVPADAFPPSVAAASVAVQRQSTVI